MHRRYGDIVALDDVSFDDVSFDVPPGRMVGFVSRNGADRSTVMRMVMSVERLCEDVVIIDDGRIVREADAALRGPAGRRVEVKVAGARTGWADHLPGTTVVKRTHDRLVLDVDATTDVDDVLMAARAAGSVTLFQVGSRSLAERFREAVDG